jgi:hypothetical protein
VWRFAILKLSDADPAPRPPQQAGYDYTLGYDDRGHDDHIDRGANEIGRSVRGCRHELCIAEPCNKACEWHHTAAQLVKLR